ncbi:cache domain-containing sensor histidine kinase [Paenibacillus humicola]|uniref:cache domain-containing sensor histidine kinase n=1 Tax=Paenibacillus humicola TaxID=3110540 RepID=UPI00237AFE8F|nr:sensor histidine kinase [Paenibacillus humicola]
MGGSLNRFLRKIKIQNRLVISFAVFSLVPLLVTSIFAYDTSSEAIKSKISTTSIQLMNQVRENIENELDKLENDSVDIAFSDIVQNTLSGFDTMNEWEKNVAELQMQSMLAKKFSFLNSVSDVLIYTQDKKKLIAYGDVNFKFNLKLDVLNDIFKQDSANNGVPLWTIAGMDSEDHISDWNYRRDNYGDTGILLTRSFKSFRGIPFGFVIMRIDEKYILRKYKDISMGTGSEMFIVNGGGTVISSRNPNMKPAKPYPDQELIQALKRNREKAIFSFNGAASGRHRLFAFSYIPGADWYVVSSIPYSYLNDESIRIGISIMVLGVVCFLLALFLSSRVSRSISTPLRKLVISMNNVRRGNLAIRIEDDSSDELGKAAMNFNHMAGELSDLIEEVKQKEKLKRLAELKTLQAQINPHFLSNSLNTVRWLAQIQKADNISGLISSLIHLLHGCMGKGSALISIRDEIEYVKDYLNIMDYRYYGKFKVHYEIEDEILDARILKFILQPIVENCLLHGLEPAGGQGLIVIKGYRAGDDLTITVTDNGVGMDDVLIDALQTGASGHHRSGLSGIGIRNVDERIKLYFGNQYGVSIQSVPGLYTAVEISIPIVSEESGGLYAEGADR